MTDPQSAIPPVWSYWEGPQPGWIDLCLRTLRRNVPGIQILTPESWGEIYDGEEIPPARLNQLKPNLKSDFIRCWLLRRFGGIWLDADCIAFDDIRKIWHRTCAGHVAAYRCHGFPCTAVLAARTSNPVMERYGEKIRRVILEATGTLGFQSVGPLVLFAAARELQVPIAMLRRERIHPISWHQHELLSREADDTEHAAISTLCPDLLTVMLTHLVLRQLRFLSSESLLASRSYAGWLFRRALAV